MIFEIWLIFQKWRYDCKLIRHPKDAILKVTTTFAGAEEQRRFSVEKIYFTGKHGYFLNFPSTDSCTSPYIHSAPL